ncbi:MAG: nucleotidyltransferase domain-containing protein [Candidatus Babeliales bacterium]
MPEKIIVTIKYGSHLFGTATPQSDVDIKGVYIPSADDILLQRVEPVLVKGSKKEPGARNKSTDVDYELYSPVKFLQAVAQGQSFALEMLFAPDYALIELLEPEWSQLKQIGMKLLTKQAAAFVGYCKQQTYKYCQKGTKLAQATKAFELLSEAEKKYGTCAKLVTIIDDLKKAVESNEHLSFASMTQPDGNEEHYFQVCGKKIPFHATLKNARLIVQNIIDAYGNRAMEATRNDGADWKALSHAVRIGNQALEFFTHHTITFPRPEREHLLAIKQGNVDFKLVTQEVEDLLAKVEQAAERSELPEDYDPALIDYFIKQLYLKQVLEMVNQ